MIIKTYGEFWSRDGIDSSKREILGRRKNRDIRCNMWDQRGVYALYDNFKIVYVGQADDRGIGRRLTEHSRDRLRKRWDSFSWFGVQDFDNRGKPRPYKGIRSTQTEAIRSLELLAILMSDAPLNRQQGKFPGAEKYGRSPRFLANVRVTLNGKLDEILKQLQLIKRNKAI
jgi:hypothetical protein